MRKQSVARSAAQRHRGDQEDADEPAEPFRRHSGEEGRAERRRRHRAEREADDDRAIDLAATPPDPREIADQHRRPSAPATRRANADRPRDERQQDDAGAEPGHAADQRADERTDDEDRPADRIGHAVSSYAECLGGSSPRARCVVSLDSMMNIAFPAIAAALAIPPERVRWIIICYVLTYALMSFAGGAAADRLGHARVFRVGLALSALAFVMGGVAADFGWLLVARVVQGLGGRTRLRHRAGARDRWCAERGSRPAARLPERGDGAGRCWARSSLVSSSRASAGAPSTTSACRSRSARSSGLRSRGPHRS